MKKLYPLGLFYVLLFPLVPLLAQPVTFQKIYGGAGNDVGLHVITAGDGYLIAGQTNSAGNPDAYLLRVDATGNVLWQKTYGGAGEESFTSVVEANDGGYVALGETDSQGGGGKDVLLMKTDANGGVIWSKTFGGPGTEVSHAQARIIKMSDGYVISASENSLGSGGYNSFMVRVTNTGSLVWTRAYTSTGNYLVANYAVADTIYAAGSIANDACFAKIDAATGDVLFLRAFPETFTDALYSVRPTQDGNFLLSDGTWSASNNTAQDAWLVKIKPDASVLWSKVYGKPNVNLQGIANNAPNGGFILAPYADEFSSSNGANLVRIDSAGTILWSYSYGRPSNDQFYMAIPTSDGGFIAVGSTYDQEKETNDLLLVKTNADGLVAGCSPDTLSLTARDFVAAPDTRTVMQPTFVNGADWNLPAGIATFPVVNLCASIPVTVDASFTLCPGEYILLGNEVYTAPAVVADTLPAGDTIVIYTLLVGVVPTIADTVILCPNTSVTINGVVYSEAGIVMDTLASTTHGCDTIVTYTIIRNDYPVLEQTVSFCSGDSVVINGVTYTQADTTISYFLPAGIGCDTLVGVTLAYAPQPTRTQNLTFCSGSSITLGGTTYTQSGTVEITLPSATGCDTLATYILEFVARPTLTQNLTFCSGDSVTLGGTTYGQSGTVEITLPATAGCDTLATYVLEFLPQPTLNRTLSFCPGESVTIDGTIYSQPDTVSGVLPATSGCDTLVTYLLELAPQPTLSQTIDLCQGDTITLGGINHTKPTTVHLIIPSTTGGCDTLATYILQRPVPTQPSTVTLACPADVYVEADPGKLEMVVDYDVPTATSDCICPGIKLSLQSGPVSGSEFLLGATDVCYQAKDSCGNLANCCFSVTVNNASVCDIKVSSCLKYELLGITQDAQQRKTYRIRTTNNCAGKMTSLAIQLPAGLVAERPINNSIYTAPGGHKYLVRNPNAIPFYSIRYSAVSDSIQNGQSDIFEYTLPQQANLDYIHIAARVEPGIFYEAYLNTFFCPIESQPNKQLWKQVNTSAPMTVFPNPTTGDVLVDLGTWLGQRVQLQIFSIEGGLVQSVPVLVEESVQLLTLPATLANGMYLLEVNPADGQKQARRFVLQR